MHIFCQLHTHILTKDFCRHMLMFHRFSSEHLFPIIIAIWSNYKESLSYCALSLDTIFCDAAKVNALLILPWLATSTNEVGFHMRPFLSQLMPVLSGTHYSWVGRSNVSEISCSRKNTITGFAWHSPINRAGSTGVSLSKELSLLRETIVNSIIWGSKQDFWDYRLTPNH